ncbi:MAG: protoporphyrinogen oxidase [Chlamydiae bacterium]|nr:protoporphyrinogen oxidase [Chlamydiota bacterium]
MKKKHILILGAGISGLSAAWYLSKQHPDSSITILEKEDRAGGWLESIDKQGFLFEKGPRIFKASKSLALLSLIQDLGLSSKIITSQAADRYILSQGEMRRLPQGLFSFLTSSYTRGMVLDLLAEPFKKKGPGVDESIESFITRRFGERILNELFNPLVQGIYAAEPAELSMQACFGMMKQLEQQYGSVVLGMIKQLRKKKLGSDPLVDPDKLFSLDGGVEVLIDTLLSQIPCSIEYGQDIQNIRLSGDRMIVTTKNKQWDADAVFCALPPSCAAEALKAAAPDAASILSSIPFSPITSILVGYDEDVLPYNGFGYLVSSKEGSPILGTVFDSKTFPDATSNKIHTKMTVMIRGVGYTKEQIEQLLDKAINKPLKIACSPNFLHVMPFKEAIPKYLVGHYDKVNLAMQKLEDQLPHFFLLGNYIQGVSVSDCIKTSYDAVRNWTGLQDCLQNFVAK